MAEYLVTGAAGFIGAALAKKLLAAGHGVVTIDNLTTGGEKNVPDGCILIRGDCQDRETLGKLGNRRFDAIFHIAGQSSGEISFDDPVYDLQSNAQSTVMLMKYALGTGCGKFLYASSMSVYGEQGDRALDENTPCVPKSLYAVGKLASEHYMRIYSGFGLETTALRLFNVYGPGQNMANLRQGMLSIYLAQALEKKKVVVKGSLERFRDFVYIDDVAKAFLACLETPGGESRVFNVGTSEKTTVGGLLALMAEKLPFSFETEVAGSTPGDTFGCRADIGLIAARTGWRPETSLARGMEEMIRWALNRRE